MRIRTLAAALLLFAAAESLCPQGSAAQRPEKASIGRWALLIGVDDYVWLRKLEYCGADMRALSERMAASGFPKDHIYVLHDKAENRYRPNKGIVEAQLDLLFKLVEPDDLVLVAFSGHGFHLNGKSYLCPADARLEDPATMISVEKLYDQLEKCPAALKLFVADACRNDPRPEGQRSVAPTKDFPELAREFGTSIERPPQGILLLTSCAPGEVAREDKEFGHGVFMHFLMEGLGGAADLNRNGRVSLMELYLYANDKTKSYVSHKYFDVQRPALKGELQDDFDLSLVASTSLVTPGQRPSRPAGGETPRIRPPPSNPPSSPAKPVQTRPHGALAVGGLLSQIDLDRDALEGTWRRDGDAIESPTVAFAQLRLGGRVPSEYRLALEVTRERGVGPLVVGLPVGPNACVVTLDADSENHVAGISLVDGNDLRKNGTGRSTSGFVNGRTSRIVCSVGPGKVDVEWDGQLAVNWRGEERRLSLPGQWSVPDTSCPFLGTNFTSFRITKAELLPAR